MIAEILGPVTVITLRTVGAWPGPKSFIPRLLAWIVMMYLMVSQYWALIDYKKWTLGETMEILALSVTNTISNWKFANLWYKRGVLLKCLDLIEEDWKNIHNEKHNELMSRTAKYARKMCVGIVVSYIVAGICQCLKTFIKWVPEDKLNFVERELIFKAKYPFDVYHTPRFEITQIIAMGQGIAMASGHAIADAILFMLTSHTSGQLDILYDRLLQFSHVGELPDMVRSHRRIIRFVETIDETFKWIALVEFVSFSIIICALGYSCVTAMESGEASAAVILFLVYQISVMHLGAFVYCHAGNVLTEKTLSIRQAAYENGWADMPPETSRMLILIMMRADKPLSLTAGGFVNLNYEIFMSVPKTAASYLSVIRASA